MLIAVDVETVGAATFVVIHPSRPLRDASFYVEWRVAGGEPRTVSFWKGYVDGALWIDPPADATGLVVTVQESRFSPAYARVADFDEVIAAQQRAGVLEHPPKTAPSAKNDLTAHLLAEIRALRVALASPQRPVPAPKRPWWRWWR